MNILIWNECKALKLYDTSNNKQAPSAAAVNNFYQNEQTKRVKN